MQQRYQSMLKVVALGNEKRRTVRDCLDMAWKAKINYRFLRSIAPHEVIERPIGIPGPRAL